MNETASHLEQIAARAATLYSRPTVAMELVRLAEQPRVEASALKECVAQDPALVCKILRVVNSSLYGLNRPVADLNQGIGLLGIKPLKLLVLGFSLPDTLFAEVAARELEWYWTNTLTRAVAARLIAEQMWQQPGDEAFTAALLQDIGILVLLRELGEPYARFLSGVIEEKCHLAALEQDTLGFDHMQLSAVLLRQWHLPQRLVEAIAVPKRPSRLVRMTSPESDLPQILYLAEMLMQLVGQRRLGVLPGLLEWGKEFRGMTKSKLTSLVESLQPQVDQLAEVLSLDISAERDYLRVLLEAHQQMSTLSEQLARDSMPGADEEKAYSQLLTHTDELCGAMQSFLGGGETNGQQAPEGDRQRQATPIAEMKGKPALAMKLAVAATRCRDRRQELSLILAEPNVYDIHTDPHAEAASRQARCALESACAGMNHHRVTLVALSDKRTAAVIADCERRAALELAQQTIAELNNLVGLESEQNGELATTLSVGVATASVVARNFDPSQMIESATRCLSAARTCGVSTVKSIEV